MNTQNPEKNVISQKSVTHVYDSTPQAEDAVKQLIQKGFPANQISIVTQSLETEKQLHGFITTGDVAKASAGTGAWVGGLFGLLTGAAFIFVPGFGPLVVAGSFATAMLGGIEGVAVGAAGGGLLGALVGWGISKEHVLKYEEIIRGGKFLVIANGDETQVTLARSILEVGAAA